ncbi:MAG: NAD(P)-dependent oxidoreductase [Acidobacteriota bacterium]
MTESFDPSTPVAFLGLGAMGSRMAQRLIGAGFQVTVYSRTADRAEPLREAGASVARTPREAAENARVVIAMVTDDAASRAVWLDPDTGALAALGDGDVAIDASTLTPDWARQLAQSTAEVGARLLDAPVVGTRPQADAGQLIFLVGGEADTYRRATPVLEVMGQHRHAGPPGHGMAIKLAANAYFALQVAGLSEALGLAVKSGLDLSAAAQILGGLPTTSPALGGVIAQIEAGSYAPLFPVDLVAKDLDYVVTTGTRVDAPTPLSRATLECFKSIGGQGYGHENISAVARLFIT